jgi:hypothetical protein
MGKHATCTQGITRDTIRREYDTFTNDVKYALNVMALTLRMSCLISSHFAMQKFCTGHIFRPIL